MRSVRVLTGTQAANLLERARDAERRARGTEALEMLDGCLEWPSPYTEQALLLRADLLTIGDAVAGLHELAANAEAFISPAGRFGYLTASARAYTRARNLDAAAAMLDSAEAALRGNGSQRDELAFARARLAWARREYDPDSEDLAAAAASDNPGIRFDALNLRAWMHAGLERYRDQLRVLVECLDVYGRHGVACGMRSVAGTIQSALMLAWELNDDAAARRAEAAFDTIEWTPEIQVYRFLSLRALAWHAFLQGDSARAQWLFKDSKDHAPAPAWKVMAHVDRAYVARMNGNQAWAAEELHEAHAIARQTDWQTTDGEERMALMSLAVLFAPLDLGHAQRYVSTYISLGPGTLDPAIEASHEPRRALAHQNFAAGRVHAVLGNTGIAIRSLEDAYGVFSEIEHDFRAALAAQALHELTGEAKWLQSARAHAQTFPESALASSLNGASHAAVHADIPGLTATQRQIALAYAQGAGIAEISQRFSRSTFTIEKHIEAIYAALGARSRSGLRTELQRRGLL